VQFDGYGEENILERGSWWNRGY